MSVLNSTILQKAWLSGSNDFQQRIPNPEIAGYAQSVNRLFDPSNADLFNEFTMLTNGISNTYAHSKRFENPLRDIVIKGVDEIGNTERHIAQKYLQAHSYKFNDETLLKTEQPVYREWFLSNSEPRRYDWSESRMEIERVLMNGQSTGFSDFRAMHIDTAYSSDAYDEMQIMIEMFALADQMYSNELAGYNGLHRKQITGNPATSEAGAKELLQAIRTDAGYMRFPSIKYNYLDIPVFDRGNSLVLWVTPDVMGGLDVQALASVFQLDKADIQYRIIQIPEFPIPNVYAALTSEDFIYGRDYLYGMEPPFYDPSKRQYKNYLFHGQRIGVNPYAQCILYTSEAATVYPTITTEVTGMSFTPNSGNVEIGGEIQTHIALTGTGASGNIAIEPDAALYTVSSSKALNSRTYVDNRGVLHVQKTGLEEDDTITVTASSVYVNPSGSTTKYTATFTATVIEPTAQGAKECAVETDPYIEYTDTTVITTASE